MSAAISQSTAASAPLPATAVQSSKVPEFEPPQASISRIIKKVLPENVQVTKEARAAFTRAAGVFIFYLTHCANDFSKDSKRSTIYTQDVLNALKELDFGEFEQPIMEYLQQQRKEQADKKASKGVKRPNADNANDMQPDEEGVPGGVEEDGENDLNEPDQLEEEEG